MPRIDIRHIAFISWLVVDLGLGATIGRQLGWGVRVHPNLPQPEHLTPDAVNVDLPKEYSLAGLSEQFPQTVERPLFVPTRRPPPPPPPPPKPSMHKGQFQLTGVMILPSTSYVMLREVSGGATRRVEKGQTINGILVKDVMPERVVLSQYDEIETLVLKVQASPKQVPGPVQAESNAPAQAALPRPGVQRQGATGRVPPLINLPGLQKQPIPSAQTAPAASPVPIGQEPAKHTYFE
jgi:hypothetical protein